MNLFITREIPEAGLRLLNEAGVTYTQWQERRELTTAELVAFCHRHDGLISAGPNRLDSTFLEACRHLKVISMYAVGYDNLDVAKALELGIAVGNTPGVLSGATADTAFLLMLLVSRKALHLHKKIVQNQWSFYDPRADLGTEVYGKTLGIFGLGNIGFEMAKRCVGAYNMKVIYHNRHHNAQAEAALGAVRVSFDELLQQSDVLSVHTALTPETRGTFNAAAFAQMKPTAIFINTARGGIHNEADLVAALQQGHIWGAGLDVTNPEPMHADSPLLQMPNVAVLPHIGSATAETRNAMAVIAARNAIAGLKGKPLPHPILL